MLTIILLSVATCLVFLYFKYSNGPKNFPPGPRGFPVVGYLPFFGTNPGESFYKLKEKYGTVVSVQVGREYWVILNDFDTIHNALLKEGEKFSGRPSNYIFEIITKGKGLVGVDYGPAWKTLRKFGNQALKGFGVGKKSMEEHIIEEIPFLLERLTSSGNKTIQIKISEAVCNIVSRVIFGSRFEYEDKRFNDIIEIGNKFFSNRPEAKIIPLMMFAPEMRFIPPFKSAVANFDKEFQRYLGYFEDIITEHEANFNANDIRDFIDAFLWEMKERGGDDPVFNKQELVQYIRDLIDGGTGTTASTLCWSLLCFAKYPEHQEKIYEEIAATIGESGIPSIEHQSDMPYTCAFIQEIMRHRTVLPMGVLHKTTEDAVLNGYAIPKNTPILPNMWSVHYDPEYFENPREFRPERFINCDGKFIKSSHVIPFSLGPRHCLGEHLAKMELFIFLTAIVQKLKILPDPKQTPPSFFGGHINLIYEAPEFQAIFLER